MIRIKKFEESIESERQIKKLAENIIPLLAEKVYKGLVFSRKYHNKSLEDTLLNKSDKGWSIQLPFDEVNKVPQFLRDFYNEKIEEHDIILYMGIGVQSRDLGGYYDKGTVVLYLKRERALEEIIEVFERYNQESRIINTIEKVLEEYVLPTLIHELAHAYDDYISKGKYQPQDYVNPEDSWEGYASQNLEVNARYTSTIAKLTDIGVKYTLDFNGVLDEFKRRFQGWSTLSNEQQKRITNRLYAWYTEPIEGKREKNRALKYIYNNASFTQLYEVVDSTFQKFKNSKVKIPDNLNNTDFPEIDVVSYIRESARQLIDGSYDRKEFNNSSIVRNRYKGFKAVEHLVDQKDNYAQMVNDIESENLGVDIEELLDNNPKYKMMHKSWQKALDKMSNLAKQLEVSEDELYTIAERFK